MNSDDLEVMHSAMPKRMQAVIKLQLMVVLLSVRMTCQTFAGNEISFKIKCFAIAVLYMCFDKT